jgi:hypothetical protein
VVNRSSRPSRRTFLVAGLVAAVVLAALGILFAPPIERLASKLLGNAPPMPLGRLASKLLGNAPSIDRLVSNYETHRSQFAALSRMASADPTFALQMTRHGAYLEDTGWRSSPSIPQVLTQGRIKQYESQLRPIGGVSMDSFPGDIDITLGSSGLVVGGDIWGYERSKQPPAAVVTLKQAHAFFHDPWCYPLGNGWYVYNNNN